MTEQRLSAEDLSFLKNHADLEPRTRRLLAAHERRTVLLREVIGLDMAPSIRLVRQGYLGELANRILDEVGE